MIKRLLEACGIAVFTRAEADVIRQQMLTVDHGNGGTFTPREIATLVQIAQVVIENEDDDPFVPSEEIDEQPNNCTRTPGHDGPCNGYATPTCPYYQEMVNTMRQQEPLDSVESSSQPDGYAEPC